MSGAGALTLVYPLDVAYTCLAADSGSRRRFRGVFHFFREAAREHGVLSLYRGLPLGLLTAFPFLCIATGLHAAALAFSGWAALEQVWALRAEGFYLSVNGDFSWPS